MLSKYMTLMAAAVLANSATGLTLESNGVPVEVSTIIAHGSGCNQSNVSFEVGAETNTIEARFSSYELDSASTRSRQRVTCNIAIVTDVPEGYSAGITNMSWAGEVAVPTDGSVKFRRSAFVAGSGSNSFSDSFTNEGLEMFSLSDDGAIPDGNCQNTSSIMRVNSSVVGRGSSSEFSLVSDGSDASLVLTIDVAECN